MEIHMCFPCFEYISCSRNPEIPVEVRLKRVKEFFKTHKNCDNPTPEIEIKADKSVDNTEAAEAWR